MDQETKTSANIQSDLPWGMGREYDPKDSKQHIKQQQDTCQWATTWRFTGGSNKKALRLRDEQEGAGIWARLQSGKSDLNCGHMGGKHGHVHLLR